MSRSPKSCLIAAAAALALGTLAWAPWLDQPYAQTAPQPVVADKTSKRLSIGREAKPEEIAEDIEKLL